MSAAVALARLSGGDWDKLRTEKSSHLPRLFNYAAEMLAAREFDSWFSGSPKLSKFCCETLEGLILQLIPASTGGLSGLLAVPVSEAVDPTPT